MPTEQELPLTARLLEHEKDSLQARETNIARAMGQRIDELQEGIVKASDAKLKAVDPQLITGATGIHVASNTRHVPVIIKQATDGGYAGLLEPESIRYASWRVEQDGLVLQLVPELESLAIPADHWVNASERLYYLINATEIVDSINSSPELNISVVDHLIQLMHSMK